MRIKNTTNNPKPEWLMGGNPGAIIKQEKQGQKQLLKSNQLPKYDHTGQSVVDVYKDWGIKVIGDSEGDDLFVDVVLPDGWEKKPTGHLWTDLIDEKGIIRAEICYKAAFYDRRAFIRIK